MRTHFGMTPTYQPILSSHSREKYTTAPAFTSAGSDFRDSLPRLAFSGILRRKPAPTAPSAVEVAQATVLKKKIDVMAREMSEGHFYIYPNGSGFTHAFYQAKDIVNFSANLAEMTLVHQKGDLSRLNLLSAQYACLFLIRDPRIRALLTKELKTGWVSVYKLKDDGFHAKAAQMTQCVKEWLNRGITPRKMLEYQAQLDRLAKLNELKVEAAVRPVQPEDGQQALEVSEAEINSLKANLKERLEAFGIPDFSDSALGVSSDIAEQIEGAVQGSRTLRELEADPQLPEVQEE